jgi:hypothetical protein
VQVQRADVPLPGEGRRHRGRACWRACLRTSRSSATSAGLRCRCPRHGPTRCCPTSSRCGSSCARKHRPAASTGQQQRTQAQASSKRDLDYSALALTDTLILLAETVFQGMPFRIQEYGASYALLQLPAVREIVTSRQWGEFAAEVVSSHARMEQLRQSPWQAMIPGLAGTLSQLQGDVQGLTAAVQQQTAAGQVQQAQGAAGPAGQREHGPVPAVPVRSPVVAVPAAAVPARGAPAGGLPPAVQPCAHSQGGVRGEARCHAGCACWILAAC